MKTISVNMRFGLSLFYEYFSVFSRFTDIQYNVSLHRDSTVVLRNEAYYDLMMQFLHQELKQFTNVYFIDNSSLPSIAPSELFDSSLQITNKHEPTYLYKPEAIDVVDGIPDAYVVVNTKLIQQPDISYWNLCKGYLKNFINKYNLTIVLIGEKDYMQCKEYEIHQTVSLYKELINEFDSLLDLTVPNTIDLYDKDIINRNLNILQKSLFNIHFGHGGGQSVFSFLNNLLTPATSRDLWFLNKFKYNHKIFVTPTAESFDSKLSELLQN